MKTIEAHFICKGERGVYRREGSFVTGEWMVPLAKANQIGRICLHQDKASVPYLVGHVDRVWISPVDGRITFAATIDVDVPTRVIDSWGRWVAYRPLDLAALTPQREALVRAVVRVGFIVAGADGLDEAESEALTEYAINRSGLSESAVAEEQKRAASGFDTLTEEDITMLRALDPEVRAVILSDIADAATADGTLSEGEAAALREVRRLICQNLGEV